jgi:hypothetical protein
MAGLLQYQKIEKAATFGVDVLENTKQVCDGRLV